MQYVYVGAGAFFQGLPAADVDDAVLSDDQRLLLAAGVQRGLYVPHSEPGELAKVMLAGDLRKVLPSDAATEPASAAASAPVEGGPHE